jgi:hypothetical protein
MEGCGAVLYDSGGLRASAHPLYLAKFTVDQTATSLMAIIHGLRCALLQGYRRPLLRTDCGLALKFARGKVPACHRDRSDLMGLARIVSALLDLCDSCQMELILKQDNAHAVRYVQITQPAYDSAPSTHWHT